jgi:16S rRNA (uracil1498-N3)-methyltransferase
MRLVRAPLADLRPGERTLDARGARYLTRVLRLREGDTFVAFDPARGKEAEATIASTTQERVIVLVGPLRDGGATGDVTWIHGAAKGDKLDAIVRDATELGVRRFVVAATARAVTKLDEDRAKGRRARWARIAEEAARQSRRADAPAVEGPLAWEDALASVAEGASRFVLWEGAQAPLGPALDVALAGGAALAFAAGPEGGLTEEEARFAEQNGWILVSLGPLILRTETVAAAVLGAVRVFGG